MITDLSEVAVNVPELVQSLDKLNLLAQRNDLITNGYFNYPDTESPLDYSCAYKTVEYLVDELIDSAQELDLLQAMSDLKAFGYTVNLQEKSIFSKLAAFSYF